MLSSSSSLSLDGSLLLLLLFIGSVDLSVEDSIKLGEVLLAVSAVGEMSCGSTGCLSCRGKQSTSLLLSSSGRLFSILSYADCFVRVLFVVRFRGACVGLCVMAGRENEYHGCSWWVSCCNMGCVAWHGKQLSSLSSSSSLGRSFSILS